MPQQTSTVFPRLQVLLGASLWGLIGLFNRQLTAGGFSAQSIVAVRNLGGLLVLTLVLLLMDRQALHIKLRHLPYFFGTGVVSVVFFTLCYFRCQQICSLAVAAILLYTSPAFVVVLSALIWRERIDRRKFAALVLAFLGCVFVSGILQGGLTLSLAGLAMGVASGFFYGLYSIFARFALKHYQPLTVTYYTFLFAGIGSLPLLQVEEVAPTFHSLPLLGSVVGLVLIATGLSWLCYYYALQKGPASKVVPIDKFSVVITVVLAFLLLHEKADAKTVIGCALIAVGTFVMIL